jgi:hypothetical protein
MSKTPIILIAGRAGSGKDTVGNYLKLHYNAGGVALADPMKRLAAELFGFDEVQLWGPSECRNAEVPISNITLPSIEGIMATCKRFVTEMGIEDKDPNGYKLLDWYTSQYKVLERNSKISPRVVLQTLGTEWGRAVDPDMWVRHALRVSTKLLSGGQSYHRLTGITSDRATNYDYVVITDGRFRNEVVGVNLVNGVTFHVTRPGQTAGNVGIAGHQSEKELDGIPAHFYTDPIVNNDTFEQLFYHVDSLMAINFGDLRKS